MGRVPIVSYLRRLVRYGLGLGVDHRDVLVRHRPSQRVGDISDGDCLSPQHRRLEG